MKPNFALNFTDTSIALLHRTARGWLKVGDTPFDASDLEVALDYMRKTALGLEPGGFATKLVIPASQILFVEVATSGGSPEETRREIIAELESRTPYKADEIVFDWTPAEGRRVKVAAVARDTLTEAESFANAHNFNPLGFVAIPQEDQFSGEPWFGMTESGSAVLADGDTLERDSQAIVLLDEAGRAARRKSRAAKQAEVSANDAATAAAASTSGEAAGAAPAQPDPDRAEDPGSAAPVAPAASEPAPSHKPEAAAQPRPATESAPSRDLFGESSADPLAPRVPASAASAPKATPSVLNAAFDRPAALAGDHPASDEAAATGPAVAITGISANRQASDLPAASAAQAPKAQIAPLAGAATSAPMATAADLRAAPTAPQGAAATALNAPAADAPRADVEEAPFAHVTDNGSFPDADEELDLPPLPHVARRGSTGVPPRAPVQPAARPALSDEVDDLPPAPAGAVMAAYNRGRSEEGAAARPRVASGLSAATAPTGAAPGPLSGAATGAAAGAPPGLQSGLRGPAAAGAAPGTARPGAFVTAPSIPGTRKARPKVTAAPVQVAAAGAPRDAARSLNGNPFGPPRKTRGKPRHLALILIAVLLLCLALVAAWSSFYLASNGAEQSSAVQLAEGADQNGNAASGLIDDEALADGEGETLLSAQDAGADLPAAPPPQAEVSGAGPAEVVLLDTNDEIFLSSADAPPPALNASTLPAPQATGEAPPGAPMPPPPFGTVYRFDDNGLLVPTAEGIPAPGGFMLYQGKPPRVPPPRSAAATAAAEAAAIAAALAAAAPEAPAPDQGANGAQGTSQSGAGNPSLVEALPLVPGAGPTAPGSTPAPDAAPAQAEATSPAVQPNPELAERRPRTRPVSQVPDEDAQLSTAPQSDTAALSPAVEPSRRPLLRPASVETVAQSARASTAAAALASTEATISLASASAAGLSANDAANPSLLTISRRPAAKPQDFSASVEAAVAAAIRAPDPAPEPEVQLASAAPPPAPKGKANAAIKPDELDEIDEPEVAASAAPKIPTKASVAKQATFTKAINLSKINLIGVYGSQSNRYALVRMANGKYRKVGIGDKIDGGQVQAITQTEVRYQKGGRLLALSMPKS